MVHLNLQSHNVQCIVAELSINGWAVLLKCYWDWCNFPLFSFSVDPTAV